MHMRLKIQQKLSSQLKDLDENTIKCMESFKDWVFSKTFRNESIFMCGLEAIIANFDFFMGKDEVDFYNDVFISYLLKSKIKPPSSEKRKYCMVIFFKKLKPHFQNDLYFLRFPEKRREILITTLEKLYNIENINSWLQDVEKKKRKLKNDEKDNIQTEPGKSQKT